MDFRRSVPQGAHCHLDIINLSPQMMEAYGTLNAGRQHIFAFNQVCFFRGGKLWCPKKRYSCPDSLLIVILIILSPVHHLGSTRPHICG